KAVDPKALQALRKITAEPEHRHEQIYAITGTYPRSASEDAILLAAADRALQFGDLVSASAYLQKLSDGTSAPDHLAAIGPVVEAHAAAAESTGPLPFNAHWFLEYAGFTQRRSIPVSAGGITFIAGASRVIAVDVEGQLLWTAHDGGNNSTDDIASDSGRGIVYEPAI